MIVFFHYHLALLYIPPLCSHHTVVHVHESLFLFFALSLHPLSSPRLIAVSLLSIYESVSILLDSSVCSLDSTYEGNHVVCVFL